MLSTMASFGAGHDSPRPLPLALALAPGDAHAHPLHHHAAFLPHHHHTILQHHAAAAAAAAAAAYPDPIRRLALASLPPPRRPASGSNTKPFTSFCIKDILGPKDAKDGDSGSSFSRHRDSSSTTLPSASSANKLSSSKPVEVGFDLSRKGRASSRSPTTPTSSATTSPPKMPVVVPSVSVNGARIVRPWVPSPSSRDTEISSDDGLDTYHDSVDDDGDDDEEEISVDDDEPSPRQRSNGGGKGGKSGVSPLDALMAMTSKTFEGLDAPDSADARRRDQAALFGKNAPPKKRRKSRTAFTNQQIYELEKRFLYQKYLTPADRDEIAHTLGLSNAQVITWFQNRRAKLKRDLEELKNDVTAAKKNPTHKTLIGTVAEMQLRRVHEQVLKKAAAEARRAERDREARERGVVGEGALLSPPSSPTSSSAAGGPSSCSPSPSLPLTSASGALSPSGSCHSNASSGSSNVCSLVASNNNHNHTSLGLHLRAHTGENNDMDSDDGEGNCAGNKDDSVDVDNVLNDDATSPTERDCPSPAPSPKYSVSPAGGHSPSYSEHVKHREENKIIGQIEKEELGSEEDMDTSEEPENLSLKPANS